MSRLLPDDGPDEPEHETGGGAHRSSDTGITPSGTDTETDERADGETEQQGRGSHAASRFALGVHHANIYASGDAIEGQGGQP